MDWKEGPYTVAIIATQRPKVPQSDPLSGGWDPPIVGDNHRLHSRGSVTRR